MPERLLTDENRRSMRMIWKTLRLRHIGMAFFWACSMLTFRSSILLSEPANTPQLVTIVVIVSFVANITTLFAIAGKLEHTPGFYERLSPVPFFVLVLVGLVLLSLAGCAPGKTALYALVATGATCAGVGYGYFWGSWAELLGRMHPSRTSFYVPVAFLATAALFLAVSLATELLKIPGIVFMIPLITLSFGCMLRCRKETADTQYARTIDSKRYKSALGSLITLIVASIVLSCLFGFVWETTVLTVGSVNQAHQIPLFVNLVVALAVVGLVLFARTRVDLSMVVTVVVPVVVILFALMPFFWSSNPVLLNAVMSASHGVLDVVIWYLVTSTAYDFAVSGFVVGALVRGLSVLARLVGIGIGYVVMLIPGESSLLIVGVSIGAVYALAMLVLFYHTRRKQAARHRAEETLPAAPSHEEQQAAAQNHPAKKRDAVPRPNQEQTLEGDAANAAKALEPEDEDESIFNLIAEEYGLTRREAEVLPYLARGRSAKVVAEALFVSESTIRTHTRRILEKTDLHSKQELIDLIERYW